MNTGILVITKEANPIEAKVGGAVTWTMHVKNIDSPIRSVHIANDNFSPSSFSCNVFSNGFVTKFISKGGKL